MTAENGIRTENKMKRLAAAIGVALAAMLAAAPLSPARADAAGTSDGNLVIDVPTTVPCALMADGTVVGTSEWNITTSGGAYIASASASGFPANVEWSARTTDLAAAQTGSVEVAGTGDAASVAGTGDPAAATLAGTARFEWSFSKLDAGKNSDIIGKAASGTAVLGSVTFTFAKPTTAFAVYSADDNSLTFYKRTNVLAADQMFEGKTATEVYEGVEDASYTATDGAPWAGHAAELASVTVADAGVTPVSTAYWFNGASKLRSVDIAALDTSQTTCMDGMFQGCSSLESLDLSAMSTRRVASMTAFLGGCDSLAELSIGSEFAWVGDDCYPPTGNWKQGSTGTDYSESQIPANKTDKYTRVKTAFAVYSADDQSLTFYKRFEVPADGAQFLGKTATEVFTGFESAVNNVPWSAYRGNVKTVTVADEGIAPVSTSMWLMGMTALKSADMSKLDTSNVANMSFMFYECNALTTLDLSSFDTRNVTNMIYMFDGCLALQKISFGADWKWVRTNGYLPTPSSTHIAGADGKWYDTDGKGYAPKDIPSNKAMTYTAVAPKKAFAVYSADDDSLTFYKRPNVPAKGAQYLGKTATEVFTGFESAVNNVPWSAYRGNVKTVTVADEGIAPVSTSMWLMGMTALKSADMSKLDTSNVANMSFMFYECNALTPLDLSSFDTSNVANMSYMFSYCGSLTNLDLSSFDTRNVANMSYMFDGCNTLTSLDLSSFDTRNVANMSYMFHGCNTLMTLDLSSFDTSKVTTMDGMFGGCKALTALDLSSFDTSKVTTMGGLFSNCDNLTTLDLSSFNTGSVKDMNGMFFNCKALKTLNLSSFDTINVTNMSSMFTQCYNLTTLDLSSFNTGSVTDMSRMFYDCNTLTSLDVPSFDTHNVKNMSNMFRFCGSLTNLDLSSFDTNKVTNMDGAFANCKSLQKVAFGTNWKWVGTNGYLPTPNSTYIAGADGKWYDTDGNGYAPKDVPSNKAMTYTAIPPKSAFAVYSADDDSLNLYKRAAVPAAGEQFEGKAAIEVYEGVEEASYTATEGAPWAGHAAELASVTVADEGIAPVSTAYWFTGASKLRSVSLAGLDTSQTTCMDGMFQGCSSLESLDLSAMSTRRVASMTAFLGGCDSLAELSIGSEFAWVGDDCFPPSGDWKQGSTGTDYAESDIPANKTDKYIRTKTAFAVYSADDGSLTFYKRFEVPSEGAAFLGKTATEVFTGFETETYGPNNSAPWSAHYNDIETVAVADGGTAPKSTASWFKGFHSLESADVSKLDMSKCKDLSYMFWECSSLGSIDLSAWDTSSFESISFMLESCRRLREVNVLGWDVSNVINMENVFAYCSNVRTLDISTWDNSKTENMNSAFSGMSLLEKVKLGDRFKWVGSNPYLPYPDDEFIPTANRKWYDTDGNGYAPADIPSNKAMTYTAVAPKKAFAVYSSDDQSLNFYKRSAVPAAGERFEGKTATAVYTGIETNEYYDTNPWDRYVDDIKTVTVVDQGIAPVSTAYWFAFCKNLTTADLTKLETSNVANMTNMFNFCSSLTKLEGVSDWNTSKVESMSSMFALCPLTSLDLSNWDTSNVEHLQCMFSTCSSLTSVGDISNWDTSKVVSMADMFTGCSSIKTLNLSNWDISNVAKLDGMFTGCSSLTTVGDISNWNTSKATVMQSMFNGCSKLSVNCSNWNVSKVTNHSNFNRNAPGVTVPLAWRTSSDEGVDESAIAPLCDERGNGDALSVGAENGKVETGSGANTTTDVADATQKAVEAKPSLEEKGTKKSDMTTEAEDAEKNGESKPEVAGMATKEGASATVPEGAEENGAVKGGE